VDRSRRVFLLRRLAWGLGLSLGEFAFAQTPTAGTADLTIVAGSDEVQVEILAPAATLIGFEGRPSNKERRETLALAVENLKAGDGLIRFNTQAFCRLDEARVDGDPKAAKGQTADLGAIYRFACDQPGALSSAAVALFMGFPALEQVRVHYRTPSGRGEALLTPRNPVVSFAPLQPAPAPTP
jgi:hypothetical protein